MCQVSELLYSFIAAILWEVLRLIFSSPTDTKRAQNHNWKESGNRILEVKCACMSEAHCYFMLERLCVHKAILSFYSQLNWSYAKNVAKNNIFIVCFSITLCLNWHLLLYTFRSITWLASLAFTRSNHEPTGVKVKKCQEYLFLPYSGNENVFFNRESATVRDWTSERELSTAERLQSHADWLRNFRRDAGLQVSNARGLEERAMSYPL